MAISQTQQVLLAVCPKITAILSLAGSSMICFQIGRRVWRRFQQEREVGTGVTKLVEIMFGKRSQIRVYHRLVFGMSVCDILSSAAWFLTTWPIPRGTPNVYGAVGTEQTCTAQGFFAQFAITTVMYNACLALYYMLVVSRGYTEAQVRKLEPFMHAFALAVGITTSLVGALLGMFNYLAWDCWIRAHPPGCIETWKAKALGVESTCTKGDNATLLLWGGFYGPLWAACLFVSIMMFMMYRSVRHGEKKKNAYNFERNVQRTTLSTMQESSPDDKNVSSGKTKKIKRATRRSTNGSTETTGTMGAPPGENREKSRKVANQGMWYVAVFYFTWFFPTVFNLILTISKQFNVPVLIATAILVPTQGIFNFIVYCRPAYLRLREADPDSSRCTTIRIIVAGKADKQLKELAQEKRRVMRENCTTQRSRPSYDVEQKVHENANV